MAFANIKLNVYVIISSLFTPVGSNVVLNLSPCRTYVSPANKIRKKILHYSNISTFIDIMWHNECTLLFIIYA